MFPKDKDIQLSFKQSKPELETYFNNIKIQFNLSKNQKDELINSVKNLIYFLKLHKVDRYYIDQDFNEKTRKENVDKYERLKKFYAENKDLVDYIAPVFENSRFHELINWNIRELKKRIDDSKNSRSGHNKIIKYEIKYLIYHLEQIGLKKVSQQEIVFGLFKLFNFDDYGKADPHDFSDFEYKERIRKQFQYPALKSLNYEEHIKLFITTKSKKYLESDEGKEMLDFSFGREKTIKTTKNTAS